MIKDIQNKKVYVYCLASVVTGGCELLHQLVDFLNDNHRDAYIVYIGKGAKKVPEAYSAYNIKVANEIEDSEGAVVVLDEGFLYLADNFKKAHLIFWWLSVDNFYNTNYFSRIYRQYGVIHTLSGYLKGVFKNRTKYIKQADINMYQSYYAKDFLKNNDVPETKLKYLSDYVNDLYTANVSTALQHNKKDIVLYNPKKGYEFTSKLINASPSLKWIPLINLTNDQVKEKLMSSKVYVDFGTHPGKDRFPREAAISGCCILTDKKGSAKFSRDVPISNEYKFEDEDKNISKIINKINFCLTNYDEAIDQFESYRKYILSEKKSFGLDCEKIFFIGE